MKYYFILLVLILLAACTQKNDRQADFQPAFSESTDLEADFINPPAYAKPRVYWWWLEGNISKEGILYDLTEMKKVGIEGVIIFDAGSSSYNKMQKTAPGPVFMGTEWQEMFVYTCRVADSLAMEVSLNIGSGWNDGGPWVTPEFASKKMVWSEKEIKGPGKLSEQLPMPEGLYTDEVSGFDYYKPVVVLAVKKNRDKDSVKPLENMEIKAVHSIRIPMTENGLGYNWDVFMKEENSIEGDCHAYLSDVLDISDKVDEKGYIHWDVPEGEFVIMRFGYTGTGVKVSTHSPGGGGLAIDYLSTDAMDLQYDQTAGKLITKLKNKGYRSLKYLHDDSWELGAANWTNQFETLFKEANGYDIIPYLPIITGRIVENRDVSNRFLYDFRRTLADLIWANHYKHFRLRAHADGLGIHPESGGPHPAPIDALKNQGLNDIPMGEFWIRANTHRITPERRLYVKQPASAAHIYGKRFVQAEGPTSIGPHWEEDFAYMKPTLDRVYCEGLNRLVIHTYTHSPKSAGVPGNEYFAGTHFNPNVTWWKQTPAFLTWNSRNSFMLSQGLFVGDVCYYYGDNVPNQVPLKHVSDNLGEGYDYDICNTEVLLDRMTVRDGKIVLPDGMSYQLLALPDRTGVTPDVMEKLEKLIDQGAIVVGPKPTTSVGLQGDQKAIEKVQLLADKVWGKANNSSNMKQSYGKGMVYTGFTLREILLSKGVQPDFAYKSRKKEALIDYIHRKTDEADIYYIVNRNERPEFIHTSFRVKGLTPECWDPITGKIVQQTIYNTTNGQTTMPLFLEPFGSVFVVFRKPVSNHYDEIKLNGKSLFPELPIDTFSVAPFQSTTDGKLLFALHGEFTLYSSTKEMLKTVIAPTQQQLIATPWQVAFDPAWGGPEQITFDKLILWNEHTNPGIRYYSGMATYQNKFQLSSDQYKNKRVYLDLGAMYNIAEVHLNGHSTGVWWQPPFSCDITEFVKEGENELQIKVVNLWPNRIIGDQVHPENRFTKTNVLKFGKDYPLRPSGLAGPVSLKLYSYN